MAAPSRSRLPQEHDRELAAELTLCGLTQPQIAARPEFRHVSRRQIGKDLERVQRRWRVAQVATLDGHSFRLLAQIDPQLKELCASWRILEGSKASAGARRRDSANSQAWRCQALTLMA